MPNYSVSRPVCLWCLLFVAGLSGFFGFAVGRKTTPLPHPENEKTLHSAKAPPIAASDTIVRAGPVGQQDQVGDLAPEINWDKQWQQWLKEPHTLKGEQEMSDALRELAVHDPERAIQMALSEPNRTIRTKLRSAVLRGWGSQAPMPAAAWAAKLPNADRAEAIQDAFAGAAGHPSDVAAAASQLVATDPTLARDYGHAAVAALVENGAFEAAAQFALQVPALRTELIGAAYYDWSQHQPAAALRALNGIADAEARTEAFQGLVSGWSAANPPAVAEYAETLAPGEERHRALAEALPRWAGEDPNAAAAWISAQGPNKDLDDGRMAIATSPAMLSKAPQVAVGWAASIADPELRSSTLQAVVDQWIQSDPVASRRFLETDTKLLPEERAAFLGKLNPPDSH